MKAPKKGTHEYDIRPLLTEEDWNNLERLEINTICPANNRRSYLTAKEGCLKAMGTDLKTSDLVTIDIIYNKIKGVF